jgi:hypothetical protein
MPRYFFAYSDQEMGDPSGLMAPGDDAAITAARNVIDALPAGLPPEDPSPTMVVKNEAGEIIYRSPAIEKPPSCRPAISSRRVHQRRGGMYRDKYNDERTDPAK